MFALFPDLAFKCEDGVVKEKRSYVDGVVMQAALASPEAAGAEALAC
ncbi:hypothetical protein [Streptomyces sp. NRRL S-337]|nr:hypothetical protein [Streptomyces sp. NRRL S-337]